MVAKVLTYILLAFNLVSYGRKYKTLDKETRVGVNSIQKYFNDLNKVQEVLPKGLPNSPCDRNENVVIEKVI